MTLAERIAEAVRSKAQPYGIPISEMKSDEQWRWVEGGKAALAEVAGHLDQNPEAPA